MSLVKEEAKKIIDKLPEQATWDDLMYYFYINKKITASLEAEEAGKILTHDEVKKRILNK